MIELEIGQLETLLDRIQVHLGEEVAQPFRQMLECYAQVLASRRRTPVSVATGLPRRRRKNLRYFVRSAHYAWLRHVERPEQLVIEARYCGLRFAAGTADRHARKLFKHGVH